MPDPNVTDSTLEPDDPRHGTVAGHSAGCLCAPCRAAKLAYDKLRRLDEMRGKPRKVPTWRAARRINALYALGWTSRQIAEVAGLQRQVVHQIAIGAHETVYVTTLAVIDEAYRALSMRVPKPSTEGERSAYVRRLNLSRRLGLHPPLAWDVIDDPDEDPAAVADEAAEADEASDDHDPVTVERILSGDWRLSATPAERVEVVRLWTGSQNELERRTGWNVNRIAKQVVAEKARDEKQEVA